VAARTANEFNLLQGERVETKQSDNIFDLMPNDPSPPPTEATNNSQDFSNMQEMFNSLNVSSTNKSNELDFFAD
jgi:hypothetical protein